MRNIEQQYRYLINYIILEEFYKKSSKFTKEKQSKLMKQYGVSIKKDHVEINIGDKILKYYVKSYPHLNQKLR